MYQKVLCAFMLLAGEVHADLIAYWNFNSYDGTSTSLPADLGSGLLTIAGFPDDDLHSLSGTTLNALGATPAGSSLTVENSLNNGDSLTLAFSMANRTNLLLSYATRRTATGFDSNQWAYSIDGLTYTDLGPPIAPLTSSSAFGLVALDFSSVLSLNDDSSVFLRYTLKGATSSTGNNRIDNIQLNATATPEPGSLVLFGSASLILALAEARRRRRRAACAPREFVTRESSLSGSC